MFRHALLLVVAVAAACCALPRERNSEAEEAKNAHYYFSSDQVNDLTQHRDEVRHGLKVRGSFLRRKVTYEADQNGYKVLKDEIEHLPGPKINPEGRTSVRTVVSGAENNYSVINAPSVS